MDFFSNLLEQQRPETTRRVVVIVPVFNRLEVTLACLENLKNQTYQMVDIVVVDGGSTDDTVESIRHLQSNVRLYANEGELWWTDAVELAISRELPTLKPDDYIFLLNNDTILERNTIERLVETSQSMGDAIVAALVKEISGRMIASGAYIVWGNDLAIPAGYFENDVKENDILAVDLVFGRATLVPVRTFSIIGNFDAKRFPHYYGDSDFFFRASQAGIPVLIDCKTVVQCKEDEFNTGLHYVSMESLTLRRAWQMATSKKSNLNLTFALRFIWKHAPGVRKITSAIKIIYRNTKIILEHYWRYHPAKKIINTLSAFPPFAFINSLIRIRPLFLTFFELRRYGFDPIDMIQKKELYPSGIPHTYNFSVSIYKILLHFGHYYRLVFRNYNPCARLRIRRFARNWLAKNRCRQEVIQQNRSGC